MLNNKRLVTGVSLLLLACFLYFNIHHVYNESNGILPLPLSQQQPRKYLIVIGSEAAYSSRRQLMRSTYFDIHDNLLPVAPEQNIEYVFCVHGEKFASDTVEKRRFETEKMEYHDIIELGLDFDQQNVLDWVYLTYMKEKNIQKMDFDYIIVQDRHSFVRMDQLLKMIEEMGNENTYWGAEDVYVMHSNIFHDIVLGEGSTVTQSPFNSQVWQNSVESVDKSSLVVKQVYLDQDFVALKQEFGFKSTELIKTQANKVIVTSSYIYDQCMEPSGTRSAFNKLNYANKHGYAFVARSKEFEHQKLKQRRTVWGKIDIIQKVLPKYDWLFWLDMDAVILNQDRSIEALMQDLQVLNTTDFIIVRPGTDKMINAGVFLIKNTPHSFEFLRDIQAQQDWYNKGPSYEQGAMWGVMQQEKYLSRTLFLDRDNHVFNTFPKFYQQNDFVVHFAPDKCPNEATMKGLAAADRLLQGKKVFAHQLQ